MRSACSFRRFIRIAASAGDLDWRATVIERHVAAVGARTATFAIDRCNFDREQRAHWLRLHPPQGIRVAVFFDVPASVAYDRVLARPAHEGGVDALHMTPSKVYLVWVTYCG